MLATRFKYAFKRFIALLKGLLHICGNGCIDYFKFAKLLRQSAFPVKYAVGRASQQTGNSLHVGAPLLLAHAGHAFQIQACHDIGGLAGFFGKTAPKHAVVKHD